MRVKKINDQTSDTSNVGTQDNQPDDTKPKVRVYVSPQSNRGIVRISPRSAMTALVVTSALILGGVSLSIWLIINQDANLKLNSYLNKLIGLESQQKSTLTLAQIEAEINKSKFIPGQPVFLNSNNDEQGDVLIPVLASNSNCDNCQQIVELRVYHPVEKEKYQLVSQVAVTGLDESFVTSPVTHPESEPENSGRVLPLTTVVRFDTKAPGIWLNLTGELPKKEQNVSYGRIVHYNPSTNHLSAMLSWTNPAGQLPYWQEAIDNDSDAPELVINQTVDLEPRFAVYQVVPRNFLPDPIDLEEVSIQQPALDHPNYLKAIILAKNGLWSNAWKQLQSVIKDGVPPVAQEQVDLIKLHAKAAESEAKKAWASPSQQVLAQLINGSWKEALEVFQNSTSEQRYEIADLLKNDSGRFWKRVEANLRVDSNEDARTWGALILAAKQGQSKANSWLQETSSGSSRIQEVLEQLVIAIAETETPNNPLSQILGSANVLTKINPSEWLQLEAPVGEKPPSLTLEEQQVWYQVQIDTFNDGTTWQQAPFSNLKVPLVKSAKQLWKVLGLNTDGHILISLSQPGSDKPTAMATVKAVQLQDRGIKLLAAGEALAEVTPKNSPRLLAHTQTALRWLEPNLATLADLSQIQPQLISAMLPKLWQELQNVAIVPSQSSITPEMLQKIGLFVVQQIDVNGNNQPDFVMTINQEILADLKIPLKNKQQFKPHTVMFSDTGSVIYSEFSTEKQQSLMGIAGLGATESTALVVDQLSNYTLKRWSSKKQKFE
ncbi:MAG TPA: hypothetical protein V6D15_20895 [Oculatellaceae cyanobacterium]